MRRKLCSFFSICTPSRKLSSQQVSSQQLLLCREPGEGLLNPLSFRNTLLPSIYFNLPSRSNVSIGGNHCRTKANNSISILFEEYTCIHLYEKERLMADRERENPYHMIEWFVLRVNTLPGSG